MKKDLLYDDDTFLARWLSGALSDAELKQFQQHPDFPYYEQLARHASKLEIPEINQQKVKRGIEAKKTQKKRTSTPKRRTLSRRLFIPAAAMLFLIIGYFALFNSSGMLLSTGIGEQLSHELPEGSMIHLNANAQILYDKGNFDGDRTIQLDGEALFEVNKGKNFKVETKNGQIEVLGTVFSVYSRNNILVVSCKSGRVRVSDKRGNEVILQQGQRVRTVAGILQNTETVSTASIGTWKVGKSTFDSEQLIVVATSLEKQFGISIELKSTLATERFSGDYLHNDLETALKMVFHPMGLSYEKSANGVYIIQ